MASSSDFVREVCIETSEGSVSLNISQQSVGDVGAVVWDSALVAAKHFETIAARQSIFFKHKRVLELGAGTGICSCVLAVLGAEVFATDLAEQLDLIKKNVEDNSKIFKGSVKVEELCWGSKTEFDNLHFNLVLLVDCLYYEASIDPLIETIKNLDFEEALCIYEVRDFGKPKEAQEMFFENAGKLFTISEVDENDLHCDFRSPDIKVLRLNKID